jgi:hypothetical protein
MFPIIALIPGIIIFPIAYIAIKKEERINKKENNMNYSTQYSPYASRFSIN